MMEHIKETLKSRGVCILDIASIVLDLQVPFNAELTIEECIQSVESVLKKREVQYALYTGIALDEFAEKNLLSEPLQSIMNADESLYGVDETLALSITNVYGMIGLTSFGYLDKVKPGIIGKLNKRSERMIHVFLDDLIAGIAAAASARIAHQDPKAKDYLMNKI